VVAVAEPRSQPEEYPVVAVAAHFNQQNQCPVVAVAAHFNQVKLQHLQHENKKQSLSSSTTLSRVVFFFGWQAHVPPWLPKKMIF
jgi:hypothetical protein